MRVLKNSTDLLIGLARAGYPGHSLASITPQSIQAVDALLQMSRVASLALLVWW
jgi:hypothetical protein